MAHKRRMNRWAVEYTTFKGTKYANSGSVIHVDAIDAETALKKFRKEFRVSKRAINGVHRSGY